MLDTKEKILISASNEFAEKGYKGTTIRAISRKAGVNLAAVNYHFSSKGILYKQVFDYLFEKTDMELTVILNKSASIDFAEWKKSMGEWVRKFLEMLLSVDPLVSWKNMIVCREINDPSEIFPRIFDTNIMPRLKSLETHFRKVLPPSISKEKIYLLVFSIISECFFYFQNQIIVSSVFSGESYLKENIDQVSSFITEQACASVKNIKRQYK